MTVRVRKLCDMAVDRVANRFWDREVTGLADRDALEVRECTDSFGMATTTLTLFDTRWRRDYTGHAMPSQKQTAPAPIRYSVARLKAACLARGVDRPILRHVMDQRAMRLGLAMDAIDRGDHRTHVLAAVLVTAGQHAVERVEDDPPDGLPAGRRDRSCGGDDALRVHLAGAQVDRLVHDGQRDVIATVLPAPCLDAASHNCAALCCHVQNRSLSHMPAAVIETGGDAARGMNLDRRLADVGRPVPRRRFVAADEAVESGKGLRRP